MCLSRGGVGGELMRGLGFTNPVGTEGVLRWCRWGVDRGLGTGSGKVGWCYVCGSCESALFV